MFQNCTIACIIWSLLFGIIPGLIIGWKYKRPRSLLAFGSIVLLFLLDILGIVRVGGPECYVVDISCGSFIVRCEPVILLLTGTLIICFLINYIIRSRVGRTKTE